jgi:hypothetical protein
LGLREKAITGSAQNRPSSPPPESAPAPVVSPPPSRADSDKDRLVTTRGIILNQAVAKSSTVNVTNAITPNMAVGASTLAFASHSAQQIFFFRNTSVPAGIGPTTGSRAGGELAQSDLKQSLNDQIKVAAGKSPLAMFQMEQTSNQIRITDSDGSVYNGDLTVANTETPAAPAAGAASVPPAITAGVPEKQPEQSVRRNEMLSLNNATVQQNQNFRFNATGTNLSLNQRVTISGEFIASTNPATLWGTMPNGGGGAGGANSQATANGSQQLSNGRIIGRVVLDNGREIPLNATSVAP